MELAPNAIPAAKKRRSTRLVQAVPMIVAGVDAQGRSFRERTSTFIINCHGCRYESQHHVPKNTWVTLIVPRREADREPRVVRAVVTWVQQPRDPREPFRIGVELETPGNVWGVAFPPDDWFPFPETTGLESTSPGVSEPATAQAPATPVPEPPMDSSATMPLGGLAEVSLALEREVKRLLTEAAEEFQAAAREKWGFKLRESAEQAGHELTAHLAQLEEQGRSTLERHLEARIQHSVEDLRRATEESSSRLAALAANLQGDLNARCERAEGLVGQMEASIRQVEGLLRVAEENLEKLTQQAVQGALGRMEGAAGTVERQFEANVRARTDKCQEEIDSQAARTIHTAVESLLKTTSGYEQSIQTQIQATFEKELEQARAGIQEKAGEVWGHVAAACLLPKDVGPPSRDAYEAMLAEIKGQTAQARSRMRLEIERLSAEFRAALVERVHQVQGSAGKELASELEASRSHLRAMLREHRDQARQALERLADQTIEEYMPLLENASNAWLVATLAKLARESEVQIENLARSTAERLQQTCDEVVANLDEAWCRQPVDSAPLDAITVPSTEPARGEVPNA